VAAENDALIAEADAEADEKGQESFA